MNFSADLLTLLKFFEGCRLTAYQDIRGVWTIGFGHTGDDVYEGLTISQDQSDNLLQQDLAKFVTGVANLLEDCTVTQSQFDALIDFSYNLGTHALSESTLLKLIKAGDMDNAANEFPRWSHAGATVVRGLYIRRMTERYLFVNNQLPPEGLDAFRNSL